MRRESVLGSGLGPQRPPRLSPATGRAMGMGISGSQTTAHKEQSPVPEENLENSSAPSVPRPIASISFCDVNGNNYYI